MREGDKTWRDLAYKGFLERVFAAEGADTPRTQAERDAAHSLERLRELLPSYRELCGAAPYHYAAGEVQRLEHRLIAVYSLDELAGMSEAIRSQLEGMAWAIRAAKGRGVELDG